MEAGSSCNAEGVPLCDSFNFIIAVAGVHLHIGQN